MANFVSKWAATMAFYLQSTIFALNSLINESENNFRKKIITIICLDLFQK